MGKKKNWLKGLRTILIFSILVVGFYGCSKNVDRRLNGTWVGDESGYIDKYNSGYFEESDKEGNLECQGTYTASDGEITSTVTHIFGSLFDLEPRWYSRNELETALKTKGIYFPSDSFEPRKRKYTISGKTLSITSIVFEGETFTATKISKDRKFTKAARSSKD